MRHLATIAIVTLLLAACQQSPEEVVRELTSTAQSGDWEGFSGHLTTRSQAMFRAALSAAPEGRPLLAPDNLTGDLEILATGQEANVARVEVRNASGESWPLILIEEDARWRIDLFECQRVWTRLRLRRSVPDSGQVRGAE